MQSALLNAEILAIHQSTATPPGLLVAGGYLGPDSNSSSSSGNKEKSKASDNELCDFCQVSILECREKSICSLCCFNRLQFISFRRCQYASNCFTSPLLL